MKKMLVLLSFLVIGIFLIGCAKSGEEGLAGQAVKVQKTGLNVPQIEQKENSPAYPCYFYGLTKEDGLSIGKMIAGDTPDHSATTDFCKLKGGYKYPVTMIVSRTYNAYTDANCKDLKYSDHSESIDSGFNTYSKDFVVDIKCGTYGSESYREEIYVKGILCCN